MTRTDSSASTPSPERPHPFTCAYCTGDGKGWRPEFIDRYWFEQHMTTIHNGLPFEAASQPPAAPDPWDASLESDDHVAAPDEPSGDKR